MHPQPHSLSDHSPTMEASVPVTKNFRRSLLAGAAALGLGLAALNVPLHAQQTPAAIVSPAPVLNYADLAEKVAPAVVSVAVTATAPRAQQLDPEELPPQLRRFFENMPRAERGAPERGPDPERQPRRMGQGSGFIIDADGTIVTNFHVVGQASEVRVKLTDGREFQARVLGGDARTDLAVLKIDAPAALPFVRFAGDAAIRVGEPVMAMGNPFGLGGTVTSGIISARGRDIGAGPVDDFVQHDAAINPGNSGGPLFNMKGEVVGVNTAILSPSGGNIGIGFAIPAPAATKVVAELREHGKVARGFVGVSLAPVEGALASFLGQEAARGAMVSQVVPDSPAAKAGIRAGDLITAIDGNPIEAPRDVVRAAGGAKQGSSLKFTLLRRDGSVEVAVTVGAAPEPAAATRRG
jgi:serine protease Do